MNGMMSFACYSDRVKWSESGLPSLYCSATQIVFQSIYLSALVER